MYFVYHILTTFALFLSFPFLYLKDSKRLKQRLGLGIPYSGKSAYKKIWVHALSVGEVLSAVPLIYGLKKRYPSRKIVLSVKTISGMEIAKNALKDSIEYILPMPLDFWWSMNRLIREIDPSVFILIETDIWPGLIKSLKKKGVNTILVNGRISPDTGRNYRKWKFLIARFWAPIAMFLMQTELDMDRMIKGGISPEKIRVTGNIKFDGQRTRYADKEVREYSRLIDSRKRPLWVAGSTHSPEERIILDVFAELIKSFPDICLVIGPREPRRFDGVFNMAESLGFKTVKRTMLPSKKPDYSVIILDTIGELGKVYGLADVAFVGGSLARIGGHNLLEPASFGVPVVFGPHTFNFDLMARLIIQAGGGKRVMDHPELLYILSGLLEKEDLRLEMGKRARSFVEQNQGALERVIDILGPYIAEHNVSP